MVGEALPAPVVTLDVTGTLVGPLHTVRIIATVTAELENSTPEAASAVIGRTLAVATGKTMAATVFGTAAGDELKPAGLLHGLTPISPATPGELTPIATDLGNLAGAIADAGIEADDLVLVTNPRQAIQLRLLAGPAFTHLVLGTTVVPSRTVIAIAPSAVAVGFSGVPSIKTSKETVLHYEKRDARRDCAARRPDQRTNPQPLAARRDCDPSEDEGDLEHRCTRRRGLRSGRCVGFVMYSDEERAEILRTARETLEQLDEQDRQRPPTGALDGWPAQRGDGGPLDADPLARPLTQSCGQLPLLPSTRLAAWRADAEARERAFKREREQRKQRDEEHVRQMTQADENWNAWADGKIAAALEALAFNDFQVEILGMTIAEERKLMRKEFAAEIDKLRQEFLAVNKIVDLPSPLIRKVRDNAA
jgi:hypothetical protein